MPTTPDNSKTEGRKTLHLHSKDFENLESEPVPGDLKADQKAQGEFEGANFYSSPEGLNRMLEAEKETRKFNRRTRKARANSEINHDRMESDT